jgi:hypothetical protein
MVAVICAAAAAASHSLRQGVSGAINDAGIGTIAAVFVAKVARARQAV